MVAAPLERDEIMRFLVNIRNLKVAATPKLDFVNSL